MPRVDLSTKTERRSLPVRRDPYWYRLSQGASLGFRRGPDTWIVRLYRPGKGYEFRALAESFDRFDDAKREAEEWLSAMTGAAVKTPKRSTVKAALRAYLAHVREIGKLRTAADAEGKFDTAIFKDKLAGLALESVTSDDFKAWRQRLAKGADREPRTINRYVRQVAAGLNMAVDKLGHVGNRKAWNLDKLQDHVEQSDKSETAVFLAPAQRSALIAAAVPAAADFFRGLELTAARPSELANATVKDFDGQKLRLASYKARGGALRVRHTVLSTEAVEFFRKRAEGRKPGDWLMLDPDGIQWRRHVWAREMRAAITKHNENVKPEDRLPEGEELGVYSFRHARISELLQEHGVDPVTVAVECGTSVAMIQRAYHKSIPSAIREKLDKLRAAS